MSVDLERELGKFSKDPNEAKAALAKLLSDGSRAWRRLYEPLSTTSNGLGSKISSGNAEKLPRPNFKAEWQRQTDDSIGLGFWKELGCSDPEEYRLTIPKFRIPHEYRDTLQFPLSIEPRISISRKLELAGIPSYINVDGITDKIEIPKIPYTVYTRPPIFYRGYYSEALRQIPDFAVGSPMTEVIDSYLKLYSRYPEFFASWVDSGNSRSGAGRVPSLDVFDGGPEVGARWAGYPSRGWRLLFRGNKIGT